MRVLFKLFRVRTQISHKLAKVRQFSKLSDELVKATLKNGVSDLHGFRDDAACVQPIEYVIFDLGRGFLKNDDGWHEPSRDSRSEFFPFEGR